MSKTIVILNPAAKGEKARRLLKTMETLSSTAEVRLTTGPGDAQRIAHDAVAEGVGTVVAAGGDGTINQVVNGLAGSDVNLGILPVGTMNVFACELGLPLISMKNAWNVIAKGKTRAIDLPRANDHYFVQLAGIGLDAQIVQETDLDFRKNFGPLSYLVSATQIAARKPPAISVTAADGTSVEGSFVLVGNGRFYGGPFVLFKKAVIDDGLLDVIVFKNLGYLDILRYLQGIVLGIHPSMSDVHYLQSKSFEIESADAVPVEIDGEVVGNTPFEFSIDSRKINVIVP